MIYLLSKRATVIKEELDLPALRVFLAVSQCHSMSGAAKLLNITQPAISSAIQRLEQNLQVELFDRTTRPLALTPSGRVLMNRANSIFESIDGLGAEILEATKGKKLDLKLACSDSISGCCVPYFIQDLLPKVNYLSVYNGQTPSVCKMLLNNKVDMIIATDPLNTVKDINCIPLHREDYLVVTPKSYKGPYKYLGDLRQLCQQLPVIRFNDKSLDSVQAERVFRQFNLHSSRRIEAGTDLMVLSLIAQNAGWTIMPVLGLWLAKDFLHAVNVHYVQNMHCERHAFLLYHNPAFASLAHELTQMIKKSLTEIVIPQISKVNPLMGKSIEVIND